MITINKNYFKIDTDRTTYLFKVNPLGILEHIYYGALIPNEENYGFVEEVPGLGYGILMKNDQYILHPDGASVEFSSKGRGDNREIMLQLDVEGDFESEFLYVGHEVVKDLTIPSLPSANHKGETLVIHLKDPSKNLRLDLYYSTYPGTDVLTRSASLSNDSDKKVVIRRFLSMQLDFAFDDFTLTTLDGTWAKERMINRRPLQAGITKIDSKCGFSSANHNPFVMIERKGCSLNYGDCFGFNLVYSGNHAEYFEKCNMHKVRFLNGINDDSFAWELKPNESFFTPEATLCFSNKGTNGITNSYHHFVRDHIVRGEWQYKDHPVLVNDWEAFHFDFSEEKLLSLAKRAKDLGVELFVLDDGWFGERHGDDSSLGDWFPNKKKLPNGLSGLSEKIHSLGLLFGLWYEPEMVSKNSELFRKHPDWALTHKDYVPLESRNQYVLDLANPQVVDYLIETISQSMEDAKLDYVKWDCNRVISDYLSPNFVNQGEFHHRYMLGLYRLLSEITKRFPHVLFESCASGGNRADLGMLCYMPCFWCSDNTEAHERVKIQEGTLLCYPQSTIGAHVSAVPNHQTGRISQIEDRFNVACIGAFGYELDPTELSDVDTLSMYQQIKWYKDNRHLLAFGDYYRLSSIFEDKLSQFVIVSGDKKEAICFVANDLFELYAPQVFLKPVGLDPSLIYQFEERQQNLDFYYQGANLIRNDTHMIVGKDLEAELKAVKTLQSEKQIAILSGESLMNAGVRLFYEVGSGDYFLRFMMDFGTRIYKIKAL